MRVGVIAENNWLAAGAILVLALGCAILPTSFWGGAVAMIGGALLTGGALRAMRSELTARSAIAIGAGASILALSRPFEGVIVTGYVLIFLLVIFRGRIRQLTHCLLISLAAIA